MAWDPKVDMNGMVGNKLDVLYKNVKIDRRLAG
jgi:hypothetical protein